MTVRILVADESEARFYEVKTRYELTRRDVSPQLHACLYDPSARLHDRDIESDRPGSAFDGGPYGSGRRSGAPPHGLGADRSPRVRATALFAHRIARTLELARDRAQFDQLVLVAAPHFLGLLRLAFPPSLQAIVIAEIHKDLLHTSEAELREHLRATFAVGAASGF